MPDLKLDNVDAQLEAEHTKPTNNRFGGLLCWHALNIRPQYSGVKYFGGRTNEIRDQFSLSVKNAARADGKRHHPTATLLETFVNRGRSC